MSTSKYHENCPHYEAALSYLAKRWTGLIIRTLLGGGKRFLEFKAEIPGISDRLLSERLKELEQQGVIQRRVFPTKPVRIEYSLTQKGIELEPVVAAIEKWAGKWCLPAKPHEVQLILDDKQGD